MTDEPATGARFTPPTNDPWKGLRGVMSGLLILQAIVVGLAFPVVGKIGGGLTAASITYLSALIVALVLAHATTWLWAYQALAAEPFEGLGLVITSLLAGEFYRLAMWHSVLRKVFSRAIPEAACPPASLAAPDQMKAVVARQILQRCPVKAWLPAPQAHLLGRPGLHRPVQGLCSFYRGIGGFAEGRGLN